MADLSLASREAHRQTTETSIEQITIFLEEVLGRKLVAALAGVADPKAVGRWAAGERAPRAAAEERLRVAYQVFRLLLAEESKHTIRAWFIGLNPQLNDESPVMVIRAGRFQEVMVAAKAYVSGG
ncbi:MAG: XRE family transcriptional regulator [Thermoleophilia bacterium]|nr:XRE family transcriptional regulator [Thermoleophilia bacterium]